MKKLALIKDKKFSLMANITVITNEARMKLCILALLGFFLLPTPSFAEEMAPSGEASSGENIQNTSRLRIFGQNGASVALFRNSSCVKSFWSSDAEKVSGGLGSAFSSFIGTVSNTSIGIPETETTRHLSQKSGILSKAYFREYALPSEKPSSMRMGFQDVSWFYVANGIRYEVSSPSCRGAITFTPHAGEDYESSFVWQGDTCTLSVNQVVSKDGKTVLLPVPVVAAPDC
jgi:hypothetical protein